MRQVVAWDGPAPLPGDYLANRGTEDLWRIDSVARRPGGALSLDLAKVPIASLPMSAMVHAWSRMAPHDAEGPARVRQVAGSGPTAVMKASWRDPDDTTPSARRTAREVSGWRTSDPLRRMMGNKGSQIEPRHILAADMLRSQVDIAVIGKGARSMESLTQHGYHPVAGPGRNALDGVYALASASRALSRLAPCTRLLVAFIVLSNHSVQAWCQRTTPASDAKIEMGKLIGALDILADHYAADIDEALARGRILEVA